MVTVKGKSLETTSNIGLTDFTDAHILKLTKFERNGKGQWITNLIFVPIFQ